MKTSSQLSIHEIVEFVKSGQAGQPRKRANRYRQNVMIRLLIDFENHAQMARREALSKLSRSDKVLWRRLRDRINTRARRERFEQIFAMEKVEVTIVSHQSDCQICLQSATRLFDGRLSVSWERDHAVFQAHVTRCSSCKQKFSNAFDKADLLLDELDVCFVAQERVRLGLGGPEQYKAEAHVEFCRNCSTWYERYTKLKKWAENDEPLPLFFEGISMATSIAV